MSFAEDLTCELDLVEYKRLCRSKCQMLFGTSLARREACDSEAIMSSSLVCCQPVCCQSANNALCLSSRRLSVQINRIASSASSASNLHARSSVKAVNNSEQDSRPTSQRLALAGAAAPFLIPLYAHCQEQAVLEQARGVSPEVLG